MGIKVKDAAPIAHLLNEHEAVTDAIARLSKPLFSVSVNTEKDDSDFRHVRDALVETHRHALHSQRDNIEHELGLLGVEVER